MIIPVITRSVDFSTADWTGLLTDEILHWSLLGKACLKIDGFPDETFVANLEVVIKRIGGAVDLQIQSDSISEPDALKLLNVGAASIVCCEDFKANAEVIPDDRMIVLSEGQQILLKSPEVARAASLEQDRTDAMVDAGWLTENDDFIPDVFSAVLTSDRPDGLWPTVITDQLGIALGLAYSNAESLSHAIKTRQGTYWSRSRNELWVKGATSGATQALLAVRMDCDRDCLRFTVTQDAPGFCHRKTHTCFGEERSIATVVQRLAERIADTDPKSFTRKLANDPQMLRTKLLEEAEELSEASQTDDLHEIAWEAADVLYFSLVAMLKNGVGLEKVHQELARRMNRVVRRKNKLEKES
jgi:phosphoribosyl-ATP pyrophosphohydrolase/phosphoribosyl-AMP cyclohydrolase/histidinol dehydrogenase